MIDVLLDGWPLVYQPGSSQALHLMTLIEHPPSSAGYIVALPNTPPSWLPQDIKRIELATANHGWGRLLWEQRLLPGIAVEHDVDLLHLTTSTPPLISSTPVLLSPSRQPILERKGGLGERLRSALAAGGMSRLKALFWPSDLPPPVGSDKIIYNLPPVVLPGFFFKKDESVKAPDGLVLPDTYILYNGPLDSYSTQRLWEVWSWAVGSIGEYYPLLIAGLGSELGQGTQFGLDLKTGNAASVQILPPLNPAALPWIYHRCTAVLHVDGISPWGNAARNALACAKPFVAPATAELDSIVGPAAYLVAEESPRALGAALITSAVEDSLAERLSEAARQRSSTWDAASFKEALEAAYRDILSP